MTQTTVYPKHRFYFNVETETGGQQIASELPSYRIACQHIKHYAKETGNQQEVYYIRLYRRTAIIDNKGNGGSNQPATIFQTTCKS